MSKQTDLDQLNELLINAQSQTATVLGLLDQAIETVKEIAK